MHCTNSLSAAPLRAILTRADRRDAAVLAGAAASIVGDHVGLDSLRQKGYGGCCCCLFWVCSSTSYQNEASAPAPTACPSRTRGGAAGASRRTARNSTVENCCQSRGDPRPRTPPGVLGDGAWPQASCHVIQRRGPNVAGAGATPGPASAEAILAQGHGGGVLGAGAWRPGVSQHAPPGPRRSSPTDATSES